jgi:hypothetical protein
LPRVGVSKAAAGSQALEERKMAARMQDQIFAAVVIVTWLTIFGYAISRIVN